MPKNGKSPKKSALVGSGCDCEWESVSEGSLLIHKQPHRTLAKPQRQQNLHNNTLLRKGKYI